MAEAASHKLQETVDEITGYRKRTRKLVIGLITVTVLSVLAAAASVYLFIRQHDSDVGNCTAGNTTRVQQAQLWHDVISLAVGPHPVPLALAFEQKTDQDVAQTYAQVDCSVRFPLF